MVTDGNGLKPIENIPQQQVRDKVYRSLRQAIVSGRLMPGERLVERKLAEQLSVSRTPVREAIRSLELEGMVYHVPRVGVLVAQIKDDEIHEVYRIRAVLEGLAARMAAERVVQHQLDRLTVLLKRMEELAGNNDLEDLEEVHQEFNDVLYSAAGSPRLYSMITSLVDHVSRMVRVGYTNPRRVAQAAREHRLILDALRMQDGELAERTAREHIESSRYAYFSERKKIDKMEGSV